VGVIASIALFAIASLEEVADLRFVDTLCHSEISIAMSVKAILVVAST
jgi:hypothetical protein